MSDLFIICQCASAKAYEVKLKDKKIDLIKAEAALKGKFDIIAATPVMMLFAINGKSTTIYTNNILIKDVSESIAKKHAEEIFKLLKKQGALI